VTQIVTSISVRYLCALSLGNSCKTFFVPFFTLVQIVNEDFNILTYFAPIAASTRVTDDVTTK